VWICTGNELAKFHGNILSISENIAKSFRGGLLFLTHTVYVAFSYILNQNLYGFNRNRIFEKSIHSVLTVVSLLDLVFYDHYCLSVCLSVCLCVCLSVCLSVCSFLCSAVCCIAEYTYGLAKSCESWPDLQKRFQQRF